jgi:hypothetical protein
MTLAEFFSWQAYAKAREREANAGPRKPDPATLPELGALGPAGIAQAIRG